MVKKILFLLCTLILSFTITQTVAYAYEDYETNVSVFVNGSKIEFDSEPIIVNDRTLVPIRAISENLGYDVGWENEHQLVTISNKDKNIFLQIGSMLLHVNDVEYEIDVAPLLHNNRTYVPLRFVTETLDCVVDWDETTSSVLVYTNNLINYEIYKDDNIEFAYPDTWIMSDFNNIKDFDINDTQATGFLIIENKRQTIEEYFEDIEIMIKEFYLGEGDLHIIEETIEEFTNLLGYKKHFAYKSEYATVYGIKVKLMTFEINDKFYTFGVYTDEYNFNNYAQQIERIYQNIAIKSH